MLHSQTMDTDCAAGTGNGLNLDLNLDLDLVDLDLEMLRPTVQHSCANLSHRPWTAVLSTYLFAG